MLENRSTKQEARQTLGTIIEMVGNAFRLLLPPQIKVRNVF